MIGLRGGTTTPQEKEERAQRAEKDIGDIPDVPTPALDLDDKEDLAGKTLVIENWDTRESNYLGADGQPGKFNIYHARVKESGEDVTFAGGVVMDKQANEVNGPFRATLMKPKKKRYWVFAKPGTKAD